MPTPLGPVAALDDPKPKQAPLTAEEIALLTRRPALREWLDLLAMGLVAAGLLGAIAVLVTFYPWKWLAPVDDPHRYAGYFLAFGALVGLMVFGSTVRSGLGSLAETRKRARLAQEDIAGGAAHELEFDVVRVVEIEEYEDEGLGFFLELADKRVLCLISQDFYRYASDVELDDDEEDERASFPQTRFRYRFAPHTGQWLDIVGIGESLRPYGRVKTTARFFKKDKETGRRSYTGPEEGMVYEGPLEATLAAFKYKLKPI